MRQLDPVTNLVLSALAALGLLATLSFPWFVPPAYSTTATDGPVERGAWQVSRFFGTSTDGRISGTDAIGSSRGILLLVVGVVIALAALVAVSAIRKQAEDLLRVAGFAAPVAVIALAVSHSGTDAPVHLHYGFLVSLVVALFVASSAFHGATVRQRQNKSPHAVRISSS